MTAALCKRDNIRAEHVERVECVVNWLETQYPSPAFPSRRTDLEPGREHPDYYAAYAILAGSDFRSRRTFSKESVKTTRQGIDDMMRRVRVSFLHTRNPSSRLV